MTFPIEFPYTFGQNQSNPGTGLPVAGWFADLYVKAPAMSVTATIPAPTLSEFARVSPPVMAVAMTVPTPGVDLVIPAPTMTAPGTSVAPSILWVIPPPTIAVTAAVPAPTLQKMLSVPVMATTAAMPTPTLAQILTISPPAMSVTATIPAPAVAISPSYDHSAQSTAQSSVASGTPFTWSSGGGTAGAYGIVFVDCRFSEMTLAGTTASVTWGGTAMTSLDSAYCNNATNSGWGWVFVLPGVAAGGAGIPSGSQTISVTLTQSGKTFEGWGSSYSYNNVSAAGSLQTAYGDSTSPAVSVTAANATDIVWGAITGLGGLPSAFSLTERQDGTVNNDFIAGDTTGSTSVTVSGTQSAQVWAAFGLDLQ